MQSTGQISSVRGVSDDNIFRLVLNKKLNLFDKNHHLMRVFMFDESDPSGTIRYTPSLKKAYLSTTYTQTLQNCWCEWRCACIRRYSRVRQEIQNCSDQLEVFALFLLYAARYAVFLCGFWFNVLP